MGPGHPGKGRAFQNLYLREFAQWDQDIFSKSQIPPKNEFHQFKMYQKYVRMIPTGICDPFQLMIDFLYGLDVGIRPKLTPPSSLSTWVGCYINSEGFLAEVFHPWVRWEGPGSGFENSSGGAGGCVWKSRIHRFGPLGIEVEKQGFRTAWLITGQKFP